MTPSFLEDHISQIPALQMLVKLGYQYLSPEEAMAARGGKSSNVILEDVLRQQLKKINKTRISSTKTGEFSDSNIELGITALRDITLVDGYMAACQNVYDLITLGIALEQSIDGDKKSFTLQFIDWQNIENNVFHVTEEFSVLRSGRQDSYRPDIVLFVNGIPLCIIECKRPDMKEPISQAISQQLRNQQEEGIRPLFIYTQLLLCISTTEGRYATAGTEEKFWAHWEEKFYTDKEENTYKASLRQLKNKALPKQLSDKIFAADRFSYVRYYFDALESEPVLPTEQDIYLYGLCRPERLLDMAYNFMLFDNGQKKIARYQQYFAIQRAIKQIRQKEGGKRKGGVIWHTQGSGKSLTMVMLAQPIAMDKSILNPKIILVTDRTDLDEQITKTFRKCGIFVDNANTGSRLVELLQSKSDAVITTIINKFETAVKKIPTPLTSENIFVLVDEGHRTQHGSFNVNMEKTLPNACFIALTGTPLFKKDKSTLQKFGSLIDAYTVDKAVRDKAVVPLLYEGRHAYQKVNEKPLDNFFNLISEPLNDYEKADLKKKFSRANQLNVAEQKIYAICWDISMHFRDNFQHKTPFKGQLVCQSKEAAVKYKMYLDEIGLVSSELIMSPPDDREGEDSAYAETSDRVKSFWKKMMAEHGNADKYQKNIVNRFSNTDTPEIIIVVDKLLTGFDAPRNTVLYLTRSLRGHTLLQAIARVNRVYPDKDYGYIIDYYGVLGALDDALELYSSFEDFDANDLEGTMTDISEELKKLAQRHSALCDIFKTIPNKLDAEAYQQLLKDEAIRVEFYDKLADFARILKLALSSIQFHKDTPEKEMERYKSDLAFFMKLRAAVMQRYSDKVDYKKFEGQIQKLIDTHVGTEKIEIITELVNIFDKEAFQEEVEKTVGQRAKADKIASRTSKHITEKMDEDPAFYKKFSELLNQTIRDYEEQRINESQYLSQVKDIMEKVLNKTDSSIPAVLDKREVAKAFYGIVLEALKPKAQDAVLLKDIAAEVALATDDIIQALLMVDWTKNVDIPKKMVFQIGDYLIDEVRDKYSLELNFGEIDDMAGKMVEVAKIRYK